MTFRYLLLILVVGLFSCNGGSDKGYDSSLPPAISPPVPLMFKVEKMVPHDPTSFTQGLEYYQGKLYEGTGETTQSKLRILAPETGEVLQEHHIQDPTIFGEGITILDNKIYQLTWQNHKIFEYNLDDISKVIRTYPWSHEGWGATNNGKDIIISDGTSTLYFVVPDPKSGTMKIKKKLTVMDNMGTVDSLNELELINGSVFANIWLRDEIVKIDTATGHVTGVLNLKGLMQQYAPHTVLTDGAVLNGIAYDSTTKRLFITGKDWPKLFEITLQ